MTTDTGKHSALRQTGDGSFEVVYETGELDPVNEGEASFAEATGAEAVRVAREPIPPRTRVMIAVGAVALLATVIIVGVVTSDSVPEPTEPGEELPVVPGFRPYGGGRADSRAVTNRARPDRAAAARAAAALDDDPEAVEVAPPVEEIVEDEAGWAVEEEPLPQDVVEPEIIEEEIVDEPVGEGESERRVDPSALRPPVGSLNPRVIPRPIGGDNLARPNFPQAGLPQIGTNGGLRDRLNPLPIRGADASEEELEAPLDELPAEEGVIVEEGELEGGVVDEEYIEEETY